ncbi:hypothetical protein [uncultured Paraglaciecola sp.]|uniref:hypothetical protein n=1 Tax=uncultured Paraglaciecola sp. TaxID=1765024 RepID=UPI0026142C60|nr:hypothetical protein [uncultured Paraglaciecola sp.]
MSTDRESVEEERVEKHRQLKEMYAQEMRSFWKKQKDEYINFFKNCPQTGRYIAVFIAGVFFCIIW